MLPTILSKSCPLRKNNPWNTQTESNYSQCRFWNSIFGDKSDTFVHNHIVSVQWFLLYFRKQLKASKNRFLLSLISRVITTWKPFLARLIKPVYASCINPLTIQTKHRTFNFYSQFIQTKATLIFKVWDNNFMPMGINYLWFRIYFQYWLVYFVITLPESIRGRNNLWHD